MATEKTPYKIYKELTLRVVVEADSPQEAYDRMLNMDDTTFEVVECGYEMYAPDGEAVSTEEFW